MICRVLFTSKELGDFIEVSVQTEKYQTAIAQGTLIALEENKERITAIIKAKDCRIKTSFPFGSE